MRRSIAIDPSHDGARLRAIRIAAGLTQKQVAQIASVKRHRVVAWEGKATHQRESATLKAIRQALEPLNRLITGQNARTREGSYDFVDPQLAALDRRHQKEVACQKAQDAERQTRKRVTCGATTRKGHPCRMKSEPRRKRCKFHGGKSMGPKTPEGKARIAEAQRKRWASYRITQKAETN